MAEDRVETAEEYVVADSRHRAREADAYRSPYEQWKAAEGLLTIRGYSIPDLGTVELTPWVSRGGAGVFINLMGTGGFNDTYVYELAPGESSEPIHHIYEDTVYILKGYGSTDFSVDQKSWQTLEWSERSYFSIPPNAYHRFHNGSGTEPMRYVAMTAAPRIIDAFKSTDFVFNNPYVFTDRFTNDADYFKEADLPPGGGRWTTNFVADVMAVTPTPGGVTAAGRGGGTVSRGFQMVNGTVRSHSQAWPGACHSTFHRHGPGIHVVLLQGRGYTLIRPDNGPTERLEWQPNTMLVPPEGWWHAHFNTGDEPASFLAIGWGSDKAKTGGEEYAYHRRYKDGGDQMEYDDEDPTVHAQFEAELDKHGATCQMGAIHPYCSVR